MPEIINIERDAYGKRSEIGHLIWDVESRRAVFTHSQTFVQAHGIHPLMPLGFYPRHHSRPQRASGSAVASFRGLHGVFNDSLPDGWGKLLTDRLLRSEGIIPDSLTPIQRLMFVGQDGPGALIYRPDRSQKAYQDVVSSFDVLARESVEILSGQPSSRIRKLVTMNGSSSGARPKVSVALSPCGKVLSGDEGTQSGCLWLVKFTGHQVDNRYTGVLEDIYARLQRNCGIRVTSTRIFESHESAGWFATERFDRVKEGRVPVVTMSGLLEASHQLPSVSYNNMMQAVRQATGSPEEESEFFRRIVFNVLAHNQDDHVKNHAIMQARDGRWTLTPAYDVTFSTAMGGEHMADISGNGKPGFTDLITLANQFNIPDADKVIERTRDTLTQFPLLARVAGVPKEDIKLMVQNMPGLTG
ncbi:type II toxin-antitoxin system HipA family toxin [Komagataeibacter saccharivorans]|uniref:type II toxin-antitoxin system HipA family toxin n=1 Tax=Komagataeibacter saccharivorans TaxID=265959 RepID=UPI0015E12676|nr:type II toxin-antitoxin system HipA family toxin [Komagataeibacter saccharivorans]